MKLTREQIQRVNKYFPRAIAAGYITVFPTGLRWRNGIGGKACFAWFIHEVLSPQDMYSIHRTEVERAFNQRYNLVTRLPKGAAELKEKVFYD